MNKGFLRLAFACVFVFAAPAWASNQMSASVRDAVSAELKEKCSAEIAAWVPTMHPGSAPGALTRWIEWHVLAATRAENAEARRKHKGWSEPLDAMLYCLHTRWFEMVSAAPAEGTGPAQPKPAVAAPRNHHPEMEATKCLKPTVDEGTLYGGFYNDCDFNVNFHFCNAGSPKETSSAAFDCAQKKGGLEQVGPKQRVAVHNKDAVRVYWVACKAPDTPLDVEYTLGQGLDFRCR